MSIALYIDDKNAITIKALSENPVTKGINKRANAIGIKILNIALVAPRIAIIIFFITILNQDPPLLEQISLLFLE